MKSMILNIKYMVLSLAFLLNACAPLVIGGAVGTSASLAHDRRSVGTVIDDNTLEINIITKLSRSPHIDGRNHISATAYNGLVLLSGEVVHPEVSRHAEQIVRGMKGVRDVRNHLYVGRSSSLAERTHDSKQTAKIKAALLEARFDATRVKVVTERGISYLMGIVNQQEALRASHIARRVSDVRSVVTLFEVR